MGWVWFIPCFHLSQSQPVSDTVDDFTLSRTDIDFAMGAGSNIIDITISLQRLPEQEARVDTQPPARLSDETERKMEGDVVGSTGVLAAVEGVLTGQVKDVVEAKQASED